jgi:NAD-dependent SIR2 family protein deacetylase
MFLRTPITKSTSTCWDRLSRLKQELSTADAVLIGAGAGLSTSAGFTYTGERFEANFGDFIQKYGFRDMYSGGFYPFTTLEEHWAYWSRYIYINRYQNPPKSVYGDLLKLIQNTDYFVLTTNVDHCFQKAGFDKKRLFYTQGDYGLWQCSKPCCQKTYNNEKIIRMMVHQQKDMRIPSDLIPRCTICGEPMVMNLRSDERFVQDEGWYAAAGRYVDFLRRHQGLHILFLELGVGFNTPGIIKYPFWQAVQKNPHSIYACINTEYSVFPPEIESRSICIQADIGESLRYLLTL